MKRILFLAAVLSIISTNLFAERLVLIQATNLNTNRITTLANTETKARFSEFGITVTSFVGKEFGLYTSATFLLPYNLTQKTDGIDTGMNIDNYDQLSLGLDAIVGVGFLAPITSNFSILFAGGLHFNGIALMSSNISYDSYLKYNLGPGIAINGLLNITNRLNFNIGLMGAWDMWEFATVPDLRTDETAKGGITWAISAGLGFKY
ncbi:MAG: hypothetical protein PF518_10415 [Spirochaetaceae bacterium]|nr:hypothetical protein [Spirochaetaceae bacterium]